MKPASRTIAVAPENFSAPGIVAVRRSALRLVGGMIRNPIETVPAECYAARMVLTHDLGRMRAYITDPALIHEALVRHADALVKSESTKRVLGPALGGGLLTSDGAMWRWQRQALAPGFQHDRLTQLLPAMITAAEQRRDGWLAKPSGSTIDVGHEMMRTTFAIILDTMLSGPEGIDATRIETGVNDVLDATSWMFALAILKAPRWVPFPGRARAAAATALMRGSVRTRVAARRTAGQGANDLMSMLFAAADPQTGRGMSDQEVADNILTFIAAGHETTAVALTWTFALLADHTDIVARLRAEIEEVTGGGPVLPHHVPGLVYAKQVVSEAMRLYPPAPIIVRTVVRDMEVGGVALPAGSLIVVPIYALHHHRDLWSDPTTFDPDRFAPEAIKARHRFAFLPFGAGPRVCIGNSFALLEATAILAVLVRAVGLERISDIPSARMRVTLRPARPIMMRVVGRAA